MSLWEITGAGTPFTLEAPNLAVAAVAVMELADKGLGVKKLGAHDAGQRMPEFRIPESRESWSKQLFGCSINALKKRVAQQHVGDLQRALASIQRGRPGERNIADPGIDLEGQGQRLADQVAKLVIRQTRLPKKTIH